MSAEKCILSIQSHVTHGYVGNKAATFPLQLHGFDVDGVNTVSLSNHSGYPVIRGHRMDLDEFKTIFDGLRANSFLKDYRYILTGYINNAAIISHVKDTIAEIRQLRKEANLPPPTYFCDPVMGDDGKLYCKEEAIEAYRAILNLADIATPNFFEASVLSGIEVKDLASAVTCADWFHAQGTPCVVIKSFPIPSDPSRLQFLVSTKSAESEAVPVRYTGAVPFYPGRYTGTGDVFAASLLAFHHSHPIDIAVGKAMGVLQDLILETRRRGGTGEASINSCELRVTDSPDSLLRPKTEVQVELLN